MANLGANSIDWISNLPPEIMEKILTLLPIEQAVKTSILSPLWRYKWTTIPDLDFDFRSGSETAINLLRGVLDVHQGPISKLTVKAMSLKGMGQVHKWLQLLSKQEDINDFQVEFKSSVSPSTYNVVPSSLFDCKKLTHVELLNCRLDVPPNFEGFLNLKTLKLDVKVVDSNIARLIGKSPLLESLSLKSRSYASDDTITIVAPKVKFLNLQGHLKDIYLEESPLLADMRLCLFNDHIRDRRFKFLGAAPNLEKLTVGDIFQATSCYRGAFSSTFNYLKQAMLSDFYLGECRGIPLVLELLTSAPNLEKLVVEVRKHFMPPEKGNSSFWEKEKSVGRCFVKLKEIHLENIYCVAPEIHFVKFMLQSSPVLEKLEMKTIARCKWTVSRMLGILPELRQATRALITFHHQPLESMHSERRRNFSIKIITRGGVVSLSLVEET